jgi:hypothetical protein
MTTDKPTVTGHTGDAKAGRSPATQAQDQQELQEQIDRTRQELGDTVEALAARADLKTRARDEAEQLKARIGERVGEVREKGVAAGRADPRRCGGIRRQGSADGSRAAVGETALGCCADGSSCCRRGGLAGGAAPRHPQ